MLKIPYRRAGSKNNRDWGAQFSLIPRVVFGNSSTSSPPTATGSNSRIYYTNRAASSFSISSTPTTTSMSIPSIETTIRGTMPADARHRRRVRHLFPANTPYLITSQGSSYSDQAILKAIAELWRRFAPR